MKLDPETLADIVARASTLDERLRTGIVVPVSDPAEAVVERRIKTWRDNATKGDAVLFEEILALRGFDSTSIRPVLGKVRLANPSRLPEWTDVLQEGLRRVGSGEPGSNVPEFLDESEPLLFEQLLSPFVEAAIDRLRTRTGEAYRRIAGSARVVTERLLLLWLTKSCSPALVFEFSVFRLRQRPAFKRLAGPQDGPSTELYRRFIARMQEGGLAAFFSEYCVLARAVSTLMLNWTDAVSEFLTRLDADWTVLEEAFPDGHSLGDVVDMKAGLSDPHNGGRTVFALKFSTGLKLVYKPKSVEPEIAYGGLLHWLGERGASLPLRGSSVLARQNYGWVKYIEAAPCSNDAELARFYRRSGMLLALFRLLDASDIHQDNLIAAGEFPMVVDAETLITPLLPGAESPAFDDWAETVAKRKYQGSVLKSALLPRYGADSGILSLDLSGLGGVGGDEFDIPAWENALTDNIRAQTVKETTQRWRNVPFLPDAPPYPGRFLDHIVSGFREVYQLLLRHRDELNSPQSPLMAMARVPMRLVFRETQTYFALLKNSLDPAMLREGVDRSIELETLSRILCVTESRSVHLPLVQAEKQSIEALDIPMFSSFPQERAIYSGGCRIADDYFPESGYDRVLKNLQNLSREDCEEQVAVIRGSLHAKSLNQKARLVPEPGRNGIGPVSPELNGAGFLDAAISIAREIERGSIAGKDHSRMWMGITFHPHAPGYRFEPLGAALFDGIPGVALFLAALAGVTGDEEFERLARGALMPPVRLIEAARGKVGWRKQNRGELESCLLIYPLVRAGALLKDAAFADCALEAADLVTPELLAACKSMDVFHGVAGILLGLLTLHESRPRARLLEAAARCADHLTREHQGSTAGQAEVLARFHAASGVPKAASITAIAAQADVDERAAPHLEELDCLYAGNFERVDRQLEAARILERPALLEAARRTASEVVHRARAGGGYSTFPGMPPQAYSPGFYQGTSGIGYGLLRLAFPGGLPSEAIWN